MRKTATQPDDPLIVESGFPALYPLSRIQQRLIQSAGEIAQEDPASILYQHTVFCQTSMPYRDPGPAIREWEREQGRASLLIEAGRVRDPKGGGWLKLGLPFGPKPRLILAHLNAEALRAGSPEVEVEASLTAFVKRIGLDPKGRNMRIIKDQLSRLSAAQIRMAVTYSEEHTRQINAHIVSGFDLWFPKNERQRVLWPSTVCLSLDYFASLQRHAVPLDERAIAALSHNAMALDVYCWLAQRLHRINPTRPAFVPWTALRNQFGWHYSTVRKFRQVFRLTLDGVLTQYRDARIVLDGRGLTLQNSPPPIRGRLLVVPKAIVP
jgi:Plasmid encoded RepA protein